MLRLLLTLSDTKSPVDPQSHQLVGLRPVDHGVIGPEAEPVVGVEGDRVVGEEEEEAGARQEDSDGFGIGPKHRQLDLQGSKVTVSSTITARKMKVRPPVVLVTHCKTATGL